MGGISGFIVAAYGYATFFALTSGIALPADMARYLAFIYQAGGALTDDAFTKVTVNTPEVLSAIKFYTGLYTDGYGKTPADLGAGWPGAPSSPGSRVAPA